MKKKKKQRKRKIRTPLVKSGPHYDLQCPQLHPTRPSFCSNHGRDSRYGCFNLGYLLGGRWKDVCSKGPSKRVKKNLCYTLREERGGNMSKRWHITPIERRKSDLNWVVRALRKARGGQGGALEKEQVSRYGGGKARFRSLGACMPRFSSTLLVKKFKHQSRPHLQRFAREVLRVQRRARP